MKLSQSKGLFFNLFGSTLDKSLPFVISLILVKFMSKYDYGLWSEYFQILTVVVSSIVSPLQLFFSKDYFKVVNTKVALYNTYLILSFLMIAWIVIVCFYPQFSSAILSLEPLILIVFYFLYSYLALYLRYSGQDRKYAMISFARAFLFILILGTIYYLNESIKFSDIMRSYVFCHLPVILYYFKSFQLKLKLDLSRLNEFIRLSIYGISTSLLSGLDRLILISSGYSYEELAAYAYAITFSSLPSFVIEAAKQYLSPVIYKDLSFNGRYTSATKSKLLITIVLLIVIQFTIPYAAIKLTILINIFDNGLVNSSVIYKVVTILNIGFAAHIVYHFVNPYLFFYNKSHLLLRIQILTLCMFYLAIKCSPAVNDYIVGYLRMTMFMIVSALTLFIISNKRFSNKYVFSSL